MSTKDWKAALLTVIPERKRKNLNDDEADAGYNNHMDKESRMENACETAEAEVAQDVKEIEAEKTENIMA